MNSIDALLRETLTAEADTVVMRPDIRGDVDSVVRRRRVVRTAAIAGGAVAAVGLALAVPAIMPDTPATAVISQPGAGSVSTSYESWAPRGGLGEDAGFVASAAAAWDAASPGASPHADVQVLWADTFATGHGAVLVGTASGGERRLAVLAGAGSGFKILRDIPAPESITHLSFNLFTDDQLHSAASYRDTLVVVTPPGSGWSLEWSGDTDPTLGAGIADTSDGIAVIDISQSGPEGHPTIRVLDGDQVRYDGPIGSQN